MNILTQLRKKKYTRSFFIAGSIAIAGLMAFRKQGPANKAPQQRHITKTGHKKNPSFLFLSDVHINTTSKTTVYGGDTGEDLWAAFLHKADTILRGKESPSFIIYTGDLPAHYSCSTGCYLPPASRTGHNNNIDTILSALHRLADKYHKPLFYLPGNNDALAGDYYSFADEQQQTPLSLEPASPYFFPKAMGNNNSTAAPCMVSAPHPTMGYYSACPVKGLRLVALNTVIFNANFTAVDGTTQQRDGNIQMIWLAAQLADAEAKKEKVYIAMHIPPGTDAYGGKSMWVQLPGNKTNWLNSFLNLTDRYKATIAGILYGHTHMDEVRRLYDSTGTHITAVAISCPGVTPQHYNNPGFKTVQYDPENMQLLDFTTYYTHPGQQYWGDSTYSFSQAYGRLPGMTIYGRLSNMPLQNVSNGMNRIFTVKNGAATYNITSGIEVKYQ